MGGLGNQMFQYAFGKALEKLHSCEVLFDNSWFSEFGSPEAEGKQINGVTVRKYALDIFNLDIKFASEDEIKKCKLKCKNNFPGFIRKAFKMPKYKPDIYVLQNDPFAFTPEILNSSNACYYEGYFQNEKYFEFCKDYIRKDFAFSELPAGYYTQIADKIKSYDNSVFIHIRRGDYLSLGDIVLNIDYYKNAVDKIVNLVNKPKFFVFGQGIEEYINNEFNIDQDFEFIGGIGADYLDMQLMSMCKHGIVANSSFSWWAAWLINNDNKVIVAPSPWLHDKNEIICDNWIRIERY